MDEFTIEREFDAPRELVFEAWSRPQHVTHWWKEGIYHALL